MGNCQKSRSQRIQEGYNQQYNYYLNTAVLSAPRCQVKTLSKNDRYIYYDDLLMTIYPTRAFSSPTSTRQRRFPITRCQSIVYADLLTLCNVLCSKETHMPPIASTLNYLGYSIWHTRMIDKSCYVSYKCWIYNLTVASSHQIGTS